MVVCRQKEKIGQNILKVLIFSFLCYDHTSTHIVMRSLETSNKSVEFELVSSSSSKALMTYCCNHSEITHHQHFCLHSIWALLCLSCLVNLGQDTVIICCWDMHYLCSIISFPDIKAALQHWKYLFKTMRKDLLIFSCPLLHSCVLTYLIVKSDMNALMMQTAQLLH